MDDTPIDSSETSFIEIGQFVMALFDTGRVNGLLLLYILKKSKTFLGNMLFPYSSGCSSII